MMTDRPLRIGFIRQGRGVIAYDKSLEFPVINLTRALTQRRVVQAVRALTQLAAVEGFTIFQD